MNRGHTVNINASYMRSKTFRKELKQYVSTAIEQNPRAGLQEISRIVKEKAGKGSYSTIASMYQAEISRRSANKKNKEIQA